MTPRPQPQRTRWQGRAWALAWALAGFGCGGAAAGSVMEEAQVDRELSQYGIDLQPAPQPSARLQWRPPPADCPHAYRLTVHYDPAQRFEDDSASDLIIGRHPRLEPEGDLIPAQLYYQGLRAERVGATRDVYVSAHMVGPAAPTAACMPRTWDPMEDAMTLGWPQLPGRLTAVGEAWPGLAVGGKCSRSACVDPKTGGGGPDNHQRTCVVPPWQERLAGLFTRGGERYAWIVSEWSDGHEPGQGIHTERRTLVSVDHGRPVWSQTVVDHRFGQPTAEGGLAPVVRTWTLESSDNCPGSLAAAGWSRPPQMPERIGELRDKLANTDELRRGGSRPRRSPRPRLSSPRPAE